MLSDFKRKDVAILVSLAVTCMSLSPAIDSVQAQSNRHLKEALTMSVHIPPRLAKSSPAPAKSTSQSSRKSTSRKAASRRSPLRNRTRLVHHTPKRAYYASRPQTDRRTWVNPGGPNGIDVGIGYGEGLNIYSQRGIPFNSNFEEYARRWLEKNGVEAIRNAQIAATPGQSASPQVIILQMPAAQSSRDETNDEAPDQEFDSHYGPRGEQNALILAALDLLSEGRYQGAKDVLRQALSHDNDSESARNLFNTLSEEESQWPGVNLGYAEFRTDSEGHSIRIDGRDASTQLPCAIISGHGWHTVEVNTVQGERYIFSVEIRGFARTVIDLDTKTGDYEVEGGDNHFYAGRAYHLAAFTNFAERTVHVPVDDSNLVLPPGTRREFHVCVLAPAQTRIKWKIIWSHSSSETRESGGCVPILDPPEKECMVHIECLEGEGDVWVFSGYKACPLHRTTEDRL